MITAYQRVDAVLDAIARIRACDPAPEELIVHVDGGEHGTAQAIGAAFPDVRLLLSETQVGPGGGRNAMVAAATRQLVASFDDDSYPIDADYFARVARLFEEFPAAAVIDAHVFHRRQPVAPDADQCEWVADFSGGGCAYRRSQFLENGGYVAIPVAYGVEEVDFALRLHAKGGRVLRAERLRVYHDTDLARHADAEVTAASVANLALLAYLRYPRRLWGIGGVQCLRRIGWLLRNGRWRGIVRGLMAIPGTIGAHRNARNPIAARALRSYFALRRNPLPVVRA
jgi:GT2 family glycosyltransferase